MELFTSVAIVCDKTLEDAANAIRHVLESFGLRVHFYRLVQRPQLLSFFGEAQYPYTIICTHGGGKSDEDTHIAFELVDQGEGDYKAPEGWTSVSVQVTPAFVKQHVRARGGTLISLACGSGYPPLAEAFLAAGYGTYIAPTKPYYNIEAGITFVVNLFYLLLAEDRDYATKTFDEQEAIREATRIDEGFEFGPSVFRGYDRGSPLS